MKASICTAAGAFALAVNAIIVPSILTLPNVNEVRFLTLRDGVAARQGIATLACPDCGIGEWALPEGGRLILNFRVSLDGKDILLNNEVLDLSPAAALGPSVDKVTSAFIASANAPISDLFSGSKRYVTQFAPFAYVVKSDFTVAKVNLRVLELQVTMLGAYEVTVSPVLLILWTDDNGNMAIRDLYVVASDGEAGDETILQETYFDEDLSLAETRMWSDWRAEETRMYNEMYPEDPDWIEDVSDDREDDEQTFEILPFVPEYEAGPEEGDLDTDFDFELIFGQQSDDEDSIRHHEHHGHHGHHEPHEEPCIFSDSPLSGLCKLRAKLMSKFASRPSHSHPCPGSARPHAPFVHGGPPKFMSTFPAPMHHLPPHDREHMHALHRNFVAAVHGFVFTVLVPLSIVLSASMVGYVSAMVAVALLRFLITRLVRRDEAPRAGDVEEGEKDGLLVVGEEVDGEEALPVYEDAPVYVEKE